MKLKKFTAILLLVLALISTLSTAASAEESIIPKDIPTEAADEDTEYTLYNCVKPLSPNRDSAAAPFSDFCVSEDGKTVALLFRAKEKTTVSVFKLIEKELEFSHGFDIILPETATAHISGESTLIWLKESGVIFAVNAKGTLQEIKKLPKGAQSEDSEAYAAVTRLFGKENGETVTADGSRFTPSDTVTAEGSTAFTRLTATNSDGSTVLLYDASAIPSAGAPTAAVLGAITALLIIAAAATEIAFAVRKKAEDSDK